MKGVAAKGERGEEHDDRVQRFHELRNAPMQVIGQPVQNGGRSLQQRARDAELQYFLVVSFVRHELQNDRALLAAQTPAAQIGVQFQQVRRGDGDEGENDDCGPEDSARKGSFRLSAGVKG